MMTNAISRGELWMTLLAPNAKRVEGLCPSVQAADGVVRSEAEPLPAGVADREAHGVGIAGVKGVFGVHGEECGGCRAAFGRGRIGDGTGIESCEADPAAVVHAAAEACLHRRIGTQ